LPKAIRLGLEKYDDNLVPAANNLAAASLVNSEVAIGAGSAANSVDVTVKIPHSDLGATAGVVLNQFEDQIGDKGKTDLTGELEKQLRLITGVQYISSWLKDSITVTFPGQAF